MSNKEGYMSTPLSPEAIRLKSERRYKAFLIDSDQILHLIRKDILGEDQSYVRLESEIEIPKGAHVLSVDYQPIYLAWLIIIAHESFDIVDPKDQIPVSYVSSSSHMQSDHPR